MSCDGCVVLLCSAMGLLQYVNVVFPDHTHLLFFAHVNTPYTQNVNEYDKEIPQSHNADQPIALRGR